MEKLPLQASGSTTGDVGPQIPEMFKQPLRVQTAPPQVTDKEGTPGSQAFTQDGNGIIGMTSMAEAVRIQDGAGMTLLIRDPLFSDPVSLQGIKVADSLQIVPGERVDLGGAIKETEPCRSIQLEILQETIKGRHSMEDDLELLARNWEWRIGASEAAVRESLDMAQCVLLLAGPQGCRCSSTSPGS
ncbi:hypothetical protein NDU88_003401 [Pleurodeles waltl]|uniref:Uncharacterized protein n=1 Tax=Pleurodeles waltl TaxID=8319 RepID=A0AAV7MDQ8_PLEWA|nr:hypothetical protein NDU88_003401 [Pleurodeles waltl]